MPLKRYSLIFKLNCNRCQNLNLELLAASSTKGQDYPLALLHETEKWPHPYLKEIGELVFHFVAIRFTQLNHAIKGSALQEQLDGLSIKSSSS